MAGKPVLNTRPLVEEVVVPPEQVGGVTQAAHIPYVRSDPSATATPSVAEQTLIDLLREVFEASPMLDELRAIRLGIEELINDGRAPVAHVDLMAMSLEMRDQSLSERESA